MDNPFSTKEERRPKKPKSGRSRWERKRGPNFSTNSLSLSYARPSINVMRTANKAEIVDMINYNEEDRVVTEINYRRTFAPSIVSRDPIGPNAGKTHQSNLVTESQYKHPAYHVTLPDIYKHLVLGNIDYANRETSYRLYDVIINLSGITLRRNTKREGASIHNLVLNDNAKQPYHLFKNVMMRAVKLIEDAVTQNKTLLVSCKAGSNRSVSAIVAYATLRAGWKEVHNVTSYIEKQKKNETSPYWDTLTNQYFRAQLHQMIIDAR